MRRETRASSRTAQGFTLIELLIVVAVIAVIGAIAIPGLLQARASSNEASAIASLRAINSSQVVYWSSCGHQHYAATLESLATPPSAGSPAFISPDLRGPIASDKSGYEIALMTGTVVAAPVEPSCNGGQLAAGYYARARPHSPGITGKRYFWTNVSGAIYSQSGAFASTNEADGPDTDPGAGSLP